MKRELRAHQAGAIEKLRASLTRGKRRPVLQAPTGMGKTVVAAAITERALVKNKRVLITVPLLSLVDQTVQALFDEGLHEIGVIQGDHVMTDWSRPVQVASVQTLQRRQQVPQADLVIVDECHRLYEFQQNWMQDPSWLQTPFVGLSATPWTRGLGLYYDDLIIASTAAELIQAGYLCDFRAFASSHPDLRGVRIVKGDYDLHDLSNVMSQPPLIADIVETWEKRAENRSTFVFAVDRAHAKHLQDRFSAAGISTGYIDAHTPTLERQQVHDRFHSGEIRVVCNVGCLTTGIDWDVRCVVLARPTKSEILYVQMIGRGLRIAEAKDYCLILDHSDTTSRLGFVTEIQYECLDDGRPRTTRRDCSFAESVSRVLIPKTG